MNLSRTIHAVVFSSDGYFVANCLEVAVVTQGRTLDETLANLREAVSLHLEDEDLDELGLVSNPSLSIITETELYDAAALDRLDAATPPKRRYDKAELHAMLAPIVESAKRWRKENPYDDDSPPSMVWQEELYDEQGLPK